VVPSSSTSAIVVSASGVSIDLGGFEIRGNNTCTGLPNDCTLMGTGRGVSTNGSVDRLEVFHGSVVGMGGEGIIAIGGRGHVVRDVRVAHNRLGGVGLQGSGNMVRDVTASLNGGSGIGVTMGTVTHCAASQNGSVGISTNEGSTVTASTAWRNASHGIQVGPGSVVSESAARDNDGIGIAAALESVVRGCAASLNTGNGIQVGQRAYVIGCASSNNSQAGLEVGDDAAYRENLITVNATGTVVLTSGIGTVFNLGNNACTNNLGATVACP
jgi:hypothetical protein